MLRFPNKRLRAKVIAEYVQASGYDGCICFSCGNASGELKNAGLSVVDVSPIGDLIANRWWQPEEIRKVWPNLFDATSGHLPAYLMIRIGVVFREHLGNLDEGPYDVPTGSGETILCLRWAYPDVAFRPVFNCGVGTERDDRSPLLSAVGIPATSPRFAEHHISSGPCG